MADATYDRIGVGYGAIRQPEPRFMARIEAALGDAATVLNVLKADLESGCWASAMATSARSPSWT